MSKLEDYMPNPVPAGWTFRTRYQIAKTDIAFYFRDRDMLHVSMSWETEHETPHLHMTFSKGRTKPDEATLRGAIAELLPDNLIIENFRMFDQISNLHKMTVHAKVYLKKAASA